jgi:hypothetical protein
LVIRQSFAFFRVSLLIRLAVFLARGGAYMKLRMRFRLMTGTSNIERPILMTLRFIDFKTNEQQPATSPSVVSSGLKNSGSNDSAESNFEG